MKKSQSDSGPLYRLNPRLRIGPFDESSEAKRWLYELADADGGVQRLVLPDRLHALLSRFHQPRVLEVDERLAVQVGLRPEELGFMNKLLLDQCLPSALIIPVVGNSVGAGAPLQAKRPSYMSMMVRLLGPRWVNALAGRMQWLYATVPMIVGAAAITFALAFLAITLTSDGSFGQLSSKDILLMVALGSIGVLLHELGHGTAAYRAGARNVSIGVGWYVCFPVAYADLSETWRMSRRQRVLVDIAGVYMQGLWVSVLMLAYAQTGHAAWLLAALSSSASMLWNLNPFLRMDGYWLASDLLGIANLRESASRSISRLIDRWRGRPLRPGATHLSSKMTTVLLIYALISSVFFIGLISVAAVHFGHAAMQVLPAYALRLWSTQWSALDWADLLVICGGFAWQLFMFAVLGRFLQLTAKRWLQALPSAVG